MIVHEIIVSHRQSVSFVFRKHKKQTSIFFILNFIVVSSPECQDVLCKNAANSIQARMNWKSDACNDFYSYCCSNKPINTIRAVKSAQERADAEMQTLLSQNTTSGMYRKLGRLYGSCLRQNVNATSIRLMLDELGGYMPIGAIGPHTLSTIMSRISSYGYNALFDMHFDLTYGRKPHIILVIDVSYANPNVLQVIVCFYLSFMITYLSA